jgi:hypothetical protein
MATNNLSKAVLLTSGLSILGSVGGIVYAINKHKGFWGGVGLFFLGGFAGTAVGYIISSTMDLSIGSPDDTTTNATATTTPAATTTTTPAQ